MNTLLLSQYETRFEGVLTETAKALETHIRKLLDGSERIDAVSVRAKSPTRFIAKALKQTASGDFKYTDPINEIQDQIGGRIIVLYLSDVIKVKSIIDNYFHSIEWTAKHPEKDEEFGYFGEHYILRLPDDVIPEGDEDNVPKFFELQIKTLFQHAWSEAHHDIGYKAPRELTPHERRQMAFSAAQSWGDDQIFLQLSNSLTPPANNDT